MNLSPAAMALAKRLKSFGERMSDAARDRILAMESSPAAALVEIVAHDAELDEGSGYAALHAVKLLQVLRPPEAIEPLLRVLVEAEWDDLIHDAAHFALEAFGAAAFEPAMRLLGETTDPDTRASILGVLSKCGVRDERLYEALIDELDTGPIVGLTVIHLGDYGDARALPHLYRLFDEHQTESVFDVTLGDIREAVQQLGGTLSERQARKLDAVNKQVRDPFRRRMDRALEGLPDDDPFDALATEAGRPEAPERPERNDPCWCGSGRKYKKCHLAADESSVG